MALGYPSLLSFRVAYGSPVQREARVDGAQRSTRPQRPAEACAFDQPRGASGRPRVAAMSRVLRDSNTKKARVFGCCRGARLRAKDGQIVGIEHVCIDSNRRVYSNDAH